MYQVDQDPETRTGTVSADCPAGGYTLEASISSPDGVELASARAGFSVAEPQEEEDDPPDSVQQQATPVDITLDSQNSAPKGVWSDGTTVWVVDSQRHKLYAYTLSSGARDSGKDITLDGANRHAEDVWSDGTTIWVADDTDDKLYAYTLSGGARDSGKEFGLASKPSGGTLAADDNGRASGVWSDGTTIWVADDTDDKLYAYTLSNGSRDKAKEIQRDELRRRFARWNLVGRHDHVGGNSGSRQSPRLYDQRREPQRRPGLEPAHCLKQLGRMVRWNDHVGGEYRQPEALSSSVAGG